MVLNLLKKWSKKLKNHVILGPKKVKFNDFRTKKGKF